MNELPLKQSVDEIKIAIANALIGQDIYDCVPAMMMVQLSMLSYALKCSPEQAKLELITYVLNMGHGDVTMQEVPAKEMN